MDSRNRELQDRVAIAERLIRQLEHRVHGLEEENRLLWTELRSRFGDSHEPTVLPDELWMDICMYLGPAELGRLARVNREFYVMLADHQLWERLYQQYWQEQPADAKSSGESVRLQFAKRYVVQQNFRNGDFTSSQIFARRKAAASVDCVHINSKYLVSGDNDGLVHVHTHSTVTEDVTFQHDSWALSLDLHDDFCAVGFASPGHCVRIFDLKQRTEMHTLRMHKGAVWTVKLCQDSVYSGATDGQLLAYNWRSGQFLTRFDNHTDVVYDCDVSRDNRLLVSASKDHTAQVWDTASGDSLLTLIGHTSSVWKISVLSDSSVVTGSRDGTVRVWDMESGAQLFASEHHGAAIDSVSVFDASTIVSASDAGQIWMWDVRAGMKVCGVHARDLLHDLCVVPAHHVVMAACDKAFRVWEMRKSVTALVDTRHSSPVMSCHCWSSKVALGVGCETLLYDFSPRKKIPFA